MKLIIKEYGDSSVGLPERYFIVECPFEKNEVEESDLIFFKAGILQSFMEYAEMRMEAFYDFEDQLS